MHELIHKAETYKPGVSPVTGDWYWSEKLDGRYAFWDGGVTRGMCAREVPWAYTSKDTKVAMSTGLWSSLGKPVNAPDWFLNQLPPFLLDGELYLGRGCFQEVISITKRDEPDDRWHDVTFKVFGAPLVRNWLRPRTISHTEVTISPADRDLWLPRLKDIYCNMFKDVYPTLKELIKPDQNVELVAYQQIGGDSLDMIMGGVCALGGEGLMLRAPWDVWMPVRADTLLKWKPWNDAEGVVVGYIAGDKRLLGMLGSLIISWQGKKFALSGMDDADRAIKTCGAVLEPGKECNIYCPAFPIGSKITFRYRELTNEGIPKEARYWRKRNED